MEEESTSVRFRSLDVYAGAGGQALGLERAGFDPVMLIDDDAHACATLQVNRPNWDVRRTDLLEFVGSDHPQVLDVDLLAAGPPRMRFSRAGKRNRPESEDRDTWKAVVWLALEVSPRALLMENVPHLVREEAFAEVRAFTEEELERAGYRCSWRVLDARYFGVPQCREHGVLVALKDDGMERFSWPEPGSDAPVLGDVLYPSMASRGWPQADEWAAGANEVAPTIVGGATGRGGADLGPSGSKRKWARLGVNGGSIGDEPPGPDFVMVRPEDPGDAQARKALPKLTTDQVKVLQGFPQDWRLEGGKTSGYRQVGHALPPPLACALGERIAIALEKPETDRHS